MLQNERCTNNVEVAKIAKDSGNKANITTYSVTNKLAIDLFNPL